MDADFPITASSCAVLVDFGVQRGLTAEECLRGTGLRQATLHKPTTEVIRRHEFRVIRNLLRHFGHGPGVGLEAGLGYHLALHGIGALALATSGTFGEAIALALRYADLGVAFMPISIREEGDAIVIESDDSRVPDDVRTFLLERNATAFMVTCRDLLGFDIVPRAVLFRHSAPVDTARYRELLGVEPQFGAVRNAAMFDRDLLDVAMPQANEVMRRGYEQACAELLAQRRRRVGTSGAVRAVLIERPGATPDITQVAIALNMSVRTLSRRLDEESTSFRILTEEVRQMLATELLVTATMTTAQVAHRLGYAEPASFIRAFKRWTGVTPQAYLQAAYA